MDATLHLVFEILAYAIGARLYWRASRSDSAIPGNDRLALLAGAIVGAFLGSKLLHIAEHLPALIDAGDWPLWLAGKSLVGGLLGGTLGVEIMKRRIGWKRPTGDAWVPALAAGIMIVRLGCQLSGTWDLTYGVPTALPWAWDYGDGVGRHPVAAYEIIAVAALWAALPRWPGRPGARFAAFILGYCTIRFALEFMKPPFGAAAPGTLPVALYAGLTAIQWAALAGALYFTTSLRARLSSNAAIATT
jgi:prolipoprotein diacylglyceryltransferase